MAENKKNRFQRLATKRVNNALKVIQLIGNLSNKANYDYDQAAIEKIFYAINEEVRRCRKRFDSNKNKTKFEL